MSIEITDEACVMLRNALPLGCAGYIGNDEARAVLAAVAPLMQAKVASNEDIERIAIKHEDFGMGVSGSGGVSIHGFQPDGLIAFVHEILGFPEVQS